MPTLKYQGDSYDCAKAIKGADYIHLLDSSGEMIVAFDGITDFTGFTLTNGGYTTPTADDNCSIAVIREDGTIAKGSHTGADVGNSLRLDGSNSMTGNLSIKRGTPIIYMEDSTANEQARMFVSSHTFAVQKMNVANDTSNRRQISLYDSDAAKDVANAIQLFDIVDGKNTGYKIYGEHNKPTASDVGAVNPNLLDNWYFADPVNQRGKTEYPTALASSYFIDRWKARNAAGTITLEDGGIRIQNASTEYAVYAEQNITFTVEGIGSVLSVLVEEKSGTSYIQCQYADGTLANAKALTVGLCEIGHPSGKSIKKVLLQVNKGASVKIKAVKLEYGDVQTLAHQDASGNWVLNEIPDKGMELLKCIQSTADSTDAYANKVVYHTGNKPTADDVVAMSLCSGANIKNCSLNDIKTVGNYYGSLSDVTDGPSVVGANSFYLFVKDQYNSGAYIEQELVMGGTMVTYRRRWNGSSWSGWASAFAAHGIAIPANANLDDYMVQGSYYITSANSTSIANIPRTIAMHLYVFRADNQIGDGDVRRTLQLCTPSSVPDAYSEIYYRKHSESGWGNWHTLATTETALMRDGSNTMTAALNFKSADNGYGAILKSHSATADYGTVLRDYDKSGKTVSFAVRANTGTVYFTDAGGTKEILHTGNLAANNIGQIITGSYVGTGTSGIDNPNSLTFARPPKWLVICDAAGQPIRINQSGVTRQYEGLLDGLTTEYQHNVWGSSSNGWSGNGTYSKVSEDRKTVFWYATGFNEEGYPTRDATAQLNTSGSTYRYMAIL